MAKIERKHIKKALEKQLWPVFLEAGFERVPNPMYRSFHRTTGGEDHFLGIMYEKNGFPKFRIEGGWAPAEAGLGEVAACEMDKRAWLYLDGSANPEIPFGGVANDPEKCCKLVGRVAREVPHLLRWLDDRVVSDRVRTII